MNRPPELSGRLIAVEDVLSFLVGDAYLPKRAAARYLGMSTRKLEGLHGIERYRIGGMLYFKRSALDKFMTDHAEAKRRTPEKRGGLRGLLEDAKRRTLAEERMIEPEVTGGKRREISG